MNHSSKVGDEIFYMDEVADEPTRPLTSREDLSILEPRIHANLSASPTAPPLSSPKSDRSSGGHATWVTPNFIDSEIEVKEEGSSPDSPEIVNGVTEVPKVNLDINGDGIGTPVRRISITTRPRVPRRPDVNVYQQKKTLAQGMMDLALLSANANQFRYVLQTDGTHPYFYPSLAMIGTSLLLQVAVGIGLIWNSRYNIKDFPQMCKANKANNWTVIGIFLVTILNVFISSFGVGDTAPTTVLTS